LLYLKINSMHTRTLNTLLLLSLLVGCGKSSTEASSRSFGFEMNFSFPGEPGFVYDHLTGDISDWWDHSFSENPEKLFIEARPGGGFYEIFDTQGNGAKHATVIFADRGKTLRMEGPLGLSGQAITLVCTYALSASGKDSTQLSLQVNGSGKFGDNSPDLIQQVWDHFLREQFKPYIEAQYARSP